MPRMPIYAGFFDAITRLLCMITRTKKHHLRS